MVWFRFERKAGVFDLKKKELMRMPILLATPKMMKIAAADTFKQRTDRRSGYSWVQDSYEYGIYMRCQTQNKILKVAFFLPEHMRSGGRHPIYELFIDKEKGQFLTYNKINHKWMTAKLDMLNWPVYVYNSKKNWISPRESALIKKYLGTKEESYIGLLQYQRGIREEELKLRHKRETDPWDLDLSQTPKLPMDWLRWVQKVGIPENYIFYKYNKKGADTGYCTFCEKDVPIKKPRHNKKGRCPCCRHSITYKAEGKAGTVITGNSYMYLIQRCRDGFLLREFEGYRKYPKGQYRALETASWECRRVIYSKAASALRAYYWGLYKQSETRWIRGGIYKYYHWRNFKGKVYGKTLPDLSKNELKYTGLIERIYSADIVDPEKYLSVLKAVPQLEQLSKGRLPRLVDECLYNYYSFQDRFYDSKARSLTGMLGINTQELKRLRKNRGGVLFLEWLKHEKATGRNIPDHVISWFCAEEIRLKDLKFILDRMSVIQIYNYIKRQMAENRMSSQEVLTTWNDYLSIARSFDLDIHDKIIFRVRKLRQRHDELVLRCREKDVSIQAGEVLKSYPKVNEICRSLKKYEYADSHYTLRAPSGAEDILWEGHELSHCVANSDNYWDRIEHQETYLMFLRRTSEVDKPYYTLEIEPDGTVRQKRTKFDRQDSDIEQAKKFLKKWQKEIAKRLTKEDWELAKKSQVLRKQELKQLREDQVIIHTGDLSGKLLADVLLADLMENKEHLQMIDALNAA